MQIRVLAPTLVGGIWHDPGVGNYEPKLAQHLIDIGVAVSYETKVEEPEVFKEKPVEKKISSASQPDQASLEKTPKKRRGRPRKLSS